jgi:hypothetical protein
MTRLIKIGIPALLVVIMMVVFITQFDISSFLTGKSDFQVKEENTRKLLGITKENIGNIGIVTLDSLAQNELPDEILNSLTNHQVIRINYDSVSLFDYDKNSCFNISTIIDPVDGKLIKISLVNCMDDNATVPNLPFDSVSKREILKGVCFHSIPDKQMVTFKAMLNSCPFGPSTSRKISSIYIMDSCSKSGLVEPKWVTLLVLRDRIRARGVPGLSDSIRNKLGAELFQIISDGKTGSPLSAS